VPSVVQTDIEIQASASRVWEILTTFERYYEWNPFVTHATGDLRRGQEIDLTLEPPDQPPLRIRPKVLEVTVPGCISIECERQGDHQIRLEPLAGGVRVIQLQRYENNLDEAQILLIDRIQLGLEMMNAALKARAER
jgi:hypothetical protein